MLFYCILSVIYNDYDINDLELHVVDYILHENQLKKMESVSAMRSLVRCCFSLGAKLS